MSHPSVFDSIAQEFKKANIPFLMVGGFAVNYYKVTRATADLDLMMTEETFQRAAPLMEQMGYHQIVKQSLFARFRADEPSFIDIDILFVDQKTFHGLYREAKEVSVGGNKIKVPSIEHLIALKAHSLKHNPSFRRIPDLVDIVGLIKANDIDVNRKEFRELCLKYGTQELYDEIIKAAS